MNANKKDTNETPTNPEDVDSPLPSDDDAIVVRRLCNENKLSPEGEMYDMMRWWYHENTTEEEREDDVMMEEKRLKEEKDNKDNKEGHTNDNNKRDCNVNEEETKMPAKKKLFKKE